VLTLAGGREGYPLCHHRARARPARRTVARVCRGRVWRAAAGPRPALRPCWP